MGFVIIWLLLLICQLNVPVFIAPAMDLDMYAHPSTKENLEKAERFGHHIIPAEFGELASGLEGQGRLAEPETILQKIEDFFTQNQSKNFRRKNGSHHSRTYL